MALDDRVSEEPRSKFGAVLDWFSARLNLTEIFSLLTSYGLFYAELDNTKGIRRAFAEALDRPTASAARWPRILSLVVVLLIASFRLQLSRRANVALALVSSVLTVSPSSK